MKQFAYALLSSFILFGTVAAQTESTDLVPEGTFTSGIEGPAVDAIGNLYAVNYYTLSSIVIMLVSLKNRK